LSNKVLKDRIDLVSPEPENEQINVNGVALKKEITVEIPNKSNNVTAEIQSPDIIDNTIGT